MHWCFIWGGIQYSVGTAMRCVGLQTSGVTHTAKIRNILRCTRHGGYFFSILYYYLHVPPESKETTHLKKSIDDVCLLFSVLRPV